MLRQLVKQLMLYMYEIGGIMIFDKGLFSLCESVDVGASVRFIDWQDAIQLLNCDPVLVLPRWSTSRGRCCHVER